MSPILSILIADDDIIFARQLKLAIEQRLSCATRVHVCANPEGFFRDAARGWDIITLDYRDFAANNPEEYFDAARLHAKYVYLLTAESPYHPDRIYDRNKYDTMRFIGKNEVPNAGNLAENLLDRARNDGFIRASHIKLSRK